MLNSAGNASTERPALNSELFTSFLRKLSPDGAEKERCEIYLKLQDRLINFFTIKGITDPAGATYETIDRAIVNIGAGAVVPDVTRYCFGIARHIASEKYRILQRETSAFRAFVDAVNNSCSELVDRIYTALKPCFEQLNESERQLLVRYFGEAEGESRAERRRQLAKTKDTSMQALRLRVMRLRKDLANCVEKRTPTPPNVEHSRN